MNRNIILGRDWSKQFGVCKYYDLGCIQIGNSYVNMEEDIHISSLARLATKTLIRLQTVKICLCIAKGTKQLLNFKFHQVFQLKTVPSAESLTY